MRTRTKIWLIIATCLVLLGCILFAGVMTTLKWDFMKLTTVNYDINTYEISKSFDSISMNSDTADITFALSDDGKCTVVCHEEENAKHSVTVEDGTLTIELIDERSVHDFIGLNFDTPEITVYLPKTEYTSLFIDESTGDIKIPKGFKFGSAEISLSTGDIEFFADVAQLLKFGTSTGDIRIENIAAGTLDLSVSTGNVHLTDIKCQSLISSGDTGDIFLKGVIAEKKFSIIRNTGHIKFDGCDAGEIFAETDTGSVKGSLLTEKIFIAQSDTGSIDVPKTVTGGKCEIITDTGDIKIETK